MVHKKKYIQNETKPKDYYYMNYNNIIIHANNVQRYIAIYHRIFD